jgi:hypothetical protein
MPRRKDPHSLAYEMGASARQQAYVSCCQSFDGHRFDCDTTAGPRCGGPFGPVKTATPAELTRRMRST